MEGMKLRDYLDAERGRLAALAKAIGAHPPDVSRWADGTRPVPVPFGWPIEEATKGAVSRRDLFPEECERIWPDLARRRNRRSTDKEHLGR